MTPKERAKLTWISVFQRKGSEGRFTKIFENFNTRTQGVLLKKAQLRDGELPVVGCYQDSQRWLLITTERVLAAVNNEMIEIANTTISSVTPTQFGSQKKADWQELTIKLTEGTNTIVEVEPGAPFFGLWNVIRNIAARNSKYRAASAQ